jgi:glycosyltransferase involved in cell wall biosynthesis
MIYISIIVPVYNRYIELKRLLDSLKNQTLKTFEVIIVDDGSTIAYEELLSSYKSDFDITYRKIENSGGPARPRNLGISLAKHDWISFLDSDDWWDPSRVEIVIDEISRNPADFYYHKLRIANSDRIRRWWTKRVIGGRMGPDTFSHLLTIDNPIPNSTVVVNKKYVESIGGISELLPCAEDFECWVRLAKNKIKFHFINKTLGYYWMSNSGLSSNLYLSAKCTVEVLQKFKNLLPENLDKNISSRIDYMYGSIEYSLGNIKKAKDYLSSAKNLPTFELRVKRFIKIIMINMGIK